MKKSLHTDQENALLAARHQAVIPGAVATLGSVYLARAGGSIVEDVEGKQYIDFAGGIGTLNAGHCPGPVLAAVREQLDHYLHSCFSVMPYEPYIQVVERLIQLTPGTFAKKGLLFNAGAEAVENAVKVARAATGRGVVLCFEGAFHGRTLLALSLTSKAATYKKGFGPFCGDVVRIPYPYCYRCPVGCERKTCDVACTSLLDDAAASYVDVSDLAAVIIEPVLGEGGFVPAPAEFLQAVRTFCNEHGAVMIADEIQTGFGRTGTLLACEQAGIEPDLITLAKSLAPGLPLSALLDAVQVGGLGGTFGGNPVSCAAALAVLDLIEHEDLPARARAIGHKVMATYRRWQESYPDRIGDVRGPGAMNALELVTDADSRAPDSALAKRWAGRCLEQGVIVLAAGVHGNVVRTLMPLTIDEEDLTKGLDRMESALSAALKEDLSNARDDVDHDPVCVVFDPSGRPRGRNAGDREDPTTLHRSGD